MTPPQAAAIHSPTAATTPNTATTTHADCPGATMRRSFQPRSLERGPYDIAFSPASRPHEASPGAGGPRPCLGRAPPPQPQERVGPAPGARDRAERRRPHLADLPDRGHE